jgi:hypothetical protein
MLEQRNKGRYHTFVWVESVPFVFGIEGGVKIRIQTEEAEGAEIKVRVSGLTRPYVQTESVDEYPYERIVDRLFDSFYHPA